MNADDQPSAATPSEQNAIHGTDRSDRPTFRQHLRLFLLRVLVFAGVFLLFAMLMTAGAGWYTSRPQFCRSCHNMEPYYVSWQESSHKDVSCIKCHFPPGAGEKVRGKLLGLVQLAKYVTSTAGPRPAAEIPDASCLRSGCHETRLLAGRMDFHGITFDHRPHLENMRRGKQLRCTSCHSQIVQGNHMTVTASTCFLCHFKDNPFNESLGACTRCHQIPEQNFDLGGGVTFSHDLAYEKGVDCANCHGDLIRGNGDVPHDRCRVCHNREDDLKKIDDHVFMHQIHVADHKVDCMACHLEIQHSLDPHKIEHAASDCTACHPNHHREQVAMLEGTGAKTAPNLASGMIAARIACPTCHRVKEVSSTGSVLWRASTQACAACHDAATVQELTGYHLELGAALAQLEAEVSRVRGAFDAANLDAQQAAALESVLNDLNHDLDFLRVANGVHNVHYADTLIRAMVERLSTVAAELKVDPPDVSLPKREFSGDEVRLAPLPSSAAEPEADADAAPVDQPAAAPPEPPIDGADPSADEPAEVPPDPETNGTDTAGTEPEVPPPGDAVDGDEAKVGEPDAAPSKPEADGDGVESVEADVPPPNVEVDGDGGKASLDAP